jgi:predicted transcriptional regulator
VTLNEIADILEATIIVQPSDLEDLNIQSACSADLMSDVLFYHAPNSLLITGLTQSSVIRTADIASIKAIVFAFNKMPDAQTIELARQKKIPLLGTSLCMYTASGKLYAAGLKGC